MRQLKLFRWAAALTLAITVAPSTASAQEDGTITISSTFYMDSLYAIVGADLAEVYANGHEHTWTLALHDATQWHSYEYLGDDLSQRITKIRATSFDLEFFGPDAATLNGIVSNYIAGGAVYIELKNVYYWGMEWGSEMAVWVGGPEFDFGLTNSPYRSDLHFPSDADGYPVVGAEPFSIWSEYSYLRDLRSGNVGYIYSEASLVTFEGSLGEPDPPMPPVVLPTLSILDGSVPEGNKGSTSLNLTVTLSKSSSDQVTVDYRTSNGTALANNDYYASHSTLTFSPGQTSRTITILIKTDRKREPNETFTVTLSNPVGATIADGTAIATILNDD